MLDLLPLTLDWIFTHKIDVNLARKFIISQELSPFALGYSVLRLECASFIAVLLLFFFQGSN